MRLLERLSGRVNEAEVYEIEADTLEVQLKSGEPRGALAREASGVAVRAIRDGRLGFAASSDRTEHGEALLVDNVLASLALGDDAGFSFAGPEATDGARVETFDPAVAGLGPADLVAIARDVLARVRERHPDVVLDVSVGRSVRAARLASSQGARHEERATMLEVTVEINRTRYDDVLQDDEYWASCRNDQQGPRALADRIVGKLDRAVRDARLGTDGRMPVLFSPAGSSVIWGPVLQGLHGQTVRAGTTPVRERVGEAVFDPRVTIVDDPLRPWMTGSSLQDDEGLPCRKNVLYDRGTLRSFVHDLRTAAATGQKPTASGRRAGTFSAPSPSFSNVVVEAGDRSLAQMLAGIDRGLWVESVIGMGQGNTLSGAFSNTVGLAYLIEKGEVVGRIKDVSLAGNVYELLAARGGALVGLSSERDTVYGSQLLPWLLLELNVVGKGA